MPRGTAPFQRVTAVSACGIQPDPSSTRCKACLEKGAKATSVDRHPDLDCSHHRTADEAPGARKAPSHPPPLADDLCPSASAANLTAAPLEIRAQRRFVPLVTVPPLRRDKAVAAAGLPPATGPSRPSFRPRPIDLGKPLPIIKSSKDLRHEDDVVVNRALPTIATGVDPSEEEERHLQQALLASVFGSSDKPPDIPVPVFSGVTPPTRPASFALPERYIHFDRTDAELVHDSVQYDADYVDDKFAAKATVPIEVVEAAMDALEKTQGAVETLITSPAACSTLLDVTPGLSEDSRSAVFNHWRRRRIERNRPFIRFFQPPPDPNDPDPAVAFRPRDREAGVPMAHRMNTYDNYKRALVIRDELTRLRRIVADIVEREKKKEQILSVNLLLQRIRITSSALPQIDNIIKHVFCSESEQVLQLPSNRGAFANAQSIALVPCRGLQIPDDIAVENKRLIVDKSAKKHRRKSKPPDRKGTSTGIGSGANAQKDPSMSADMTNVEKNHISMTHGQQAQQQSPYDTFWFDEHGNRFLKLMRCFAGGFINYGVSPFDHRVFSAASERNTVRAMPREPKTTFFPDSSLKFARRIGSPLTTAKPTEARDSSSQFVTPDEVKEDIWQGRTRPPPPVEEVEHPPKRRRVIRVRGRVGRGGRVVLDRVPFERERGANVASYPASVDMGGVYTGGIPLTAAHEVAKEESYGAMGQVSLLSPTSVQDDDELRFHNHTTTNFFDELYEPIKPMADISKGRGLQVDAVNYWPRQRRRGRRGKEAPHRREPAERDDDDDDDDDDEDDGDVIETGLIDSSLDDRFNELRSLPAYHPRDGPGVTSLND